LTHRSHPSDLDFRRDGAQAIALLSKVYSIYFAESDNSSKTISITGDLPVSGKYEKYKAVKKLWRETKVFRM